jgi:hypothetical protein
LVTRWREMYKSSQGVCSMYHLAPNCISATCEMASESVRGQPEDYLEFILLVELGFTCANEACTHRVHLSVTPGVSLTDFHSHSPHIIALTSVIPSSYLV